MGFLDEYNKALKEEEAKKKKKKKASTEKKSSSFMDTYRSSLSELKQVEHDEVAPILPTASTKKEEKDERTWFDSGAFDDGYQFGDVTKTILGSGADLLENVGSGIMGMGEAVVDALATISPYVMQSQMSQVPVFDEKLRQQQEELVKQATNEAKDFVSKDLYDEEAIAKAIITNPLRDLTGIDAEKDSVFGEKSDALVQSAGQLAATYGLSMVGVPWFVTTGVTSFGSEAESAVRQDASLSEAMTSGFVSAGAEILSETLFGGDLFVKNAGADAATTLLASSISNKTLRTMAKLGMDMTGEGVEEVFSQVVGNLGSSLYKEKDIGEILFDEEALDGYIESFVGGVVLGGGMSAINVAQSNKAGVDYVTNLTANEEAVVEKVYKDRLAEAEENGKVSTKEKQKIYDQVLKDMDKGYISTDDIESVLSGDSYKSWQQHTDWENQLQQEIETLENMPNAEITVKQSEQLKHLREELASHQEKFDTKNFKSILSEKAMNLVKDTRLAESYNERARRGQTFEADLSKYDEKQQAVIQKAIDSGILNNTNRTHEFVDIIAKISADKGVLFDFTNNEKLKDSGFAVDGKQVNGYVTKDGITLNIDSPKAWQSTVGHEITHVLEGTEFYDTLSEVVKNYAISKEGLENFNKRLKATEGLYKGMDAEVDKEIVADLVGDYLFQDADFINHLSTANRNVFQKIYDEIKYLYKVVTAGSKEARELEKVKRAFEEAYRAGNNAVDKTKHSISDSDGKELTKEQQEYFKDSKMRDENGNLKVMYHGSQDAGFHVFDAKMSDDDTSFFFVDRNDVAASYSGTTETYEAKTIRTAEDMNRFLAEIGQDEDYSVVEKDGQFILLYDGDRVAASDTAPGIYKEFCWYEGIGEGDANYKVYLNLTNPLEVDAQGRNWDMVGREFSQNLYDKYMSLTDAEKSALVDATKWDDFGTFRDEVNDAVDYVANQARNGGFIDDYQRSIASAVEKLRNSKGELDMYTLHYFATENFAENVIREDATEWLKTRDYAQKAKAEGYDGVIFKNIVDVGGYGGEYTPSTVAIAFDSNQIKSVANAKPTKNADIRYSLSRAEEIENAYQYNLENEDMLGAEMAVEEMANIMMPDSKIRDKKGRLIPVYHGTKAMFWEFDTSADGGKNGTAEGYGIYLSDDTEVTEAYGDRQLKMYANITKPATSKKKTITVSTLAKLIKDTCLREAQRMVADGDHDNIKDALFDTWVSNYVYTYDIGMERAYREVANTIRNMESGDMGIVQEVMSGMGIRDYADAMDFYRNSLTPITGFDGFITQWENSGTGKKSNIYLAFDSSQLKSADPVTYDDSGNVIPLSERFNAENPDIRYSLSDAVTDEQNAHGLDAKSEVQFSLSNDSAYMDNAVKANNSAMRVDSKVLGETKALRERIAARMNAIKDRGLVGLPEDIEGNTYIANSSYDGTEENTTICPRSLASEAFVDAVSEYLGRPLSVNEQIYISQDLQGRSLTPECTYCYVATDRKAYRAFLGEYVAQRDAVLQKVQENPGADVSRSGELYKEFLNGRKDTNPMYSRFKMWVESYKSGKPMIDASHLANINKLMGDINSEFGAKLKPQIVDAMKYAQSASWAKKRVNYVAYNGHILKWKQDRINKLNSHYGLRMYSFSDFHPAFVLENMQMITDASVRGLKMLGYTKDTDFVEIFAPSGMNINISTFGFESGGNVYENNIIGAEWAKAQELREQYPNVGITFVATNDTLVEWALAQDWIDVVIPYHLVRTGTEVAKAFGYTNYTSESADTKTKDWVKGDEKSIAPTEHNNDLETYLKALEKNHLNPRFERFRSNPNYMKLVNECRQSASQSKPVQPVFNEDAAMRVLAKLEANGYYQPIGGSVDRMYEIAAEVAENMSRELAPAMSMSQEGEQFKRYGNFATPAKDLRLEVAPVAKTATTTEESTVVPATVSEVESVAPVAEENLFPDDLSELDDLIAQRDQLMGALEAAQAAGDANALSQLAQEYEAVNSRIRELENAESERTDSLMDADVPPEMEAPYTETTNAPVEDPFAEREWDEVVGKKGRKAKAYMYEHPEVKPFFQAEAQNLLGELTDTQKGERWYNDEVYYESGGEKGWGGQKRLTSQSMETLLDEWGMSYDDIEKGLKAIIEDHGAENISAAKKIEFMLNDRLLNGYKNFYDNGFVEPNRDYIKLLEEMQINTYSKEAFDSLVANADQYAPIGEEVVVSKNETTTPALETVNTDSMKGVVKGQQTYITTEDKLKKANSQPVNEIAPLREVNKQSPKVAQVLTEEAEITKEKSGIGGKLVSALVDKGMVFENLSLEKGNHEIQAKWNYALPSNTEARAQYFMENGADGVKSLKETLGEVNKSGKKGAFFDYLYHVHNIDRMTLGERFGLPDMTVFGDTVTADVSRKKVAQYEKTNPEFKAWAEDIYAINKYLRKELVKGNIITQKTSDWWEKKYPHYVPIRRVDSKGQNISVPLDTNKTGVNNPIKKATGGNSNIQPLDVTMAQRIEQVYRAIARNSFGIELKNTLGTTIVPKQKATKKNDVAPGQLTYMDVDETIDTIEAQEEKLLKPGTKDSNPTFTVFENGERVEFEITEDMFDALKPAGKLLGHRSKAITAVGDARRNLLTVWNPVFALYRNPIKDIQDVAVNSQHAAKTYLNVPNAIFQMATGGEYATEYHKNGGKSNTYFDSRNNKFKVEDSAFKKAIGMPVRAIENAGEFIEEIPRLAEYIASRQEGRSVERSMLDAARVTTNFAAGGDFTKFLNSHGFTFLNASVQGASQHIRNFREAKQQGLKGYVKVLAKYAVAGLPTILLNSMLWDDDEEYEELSDYVKQNYYVVAKTQDGKFVRIPKGRTAAVIGELMNQMEHLVTGNDEVDFSTFFELFMNNIAPSNPLENNILAPIGQVMTNTAWYGGDLVPSRLQKLPAEEQYDESTDSISKWLGENFDPFGLGPYKINYLIDQYSGGLGDVFLPMMTPEAESGDDSIAGNFLAPWKKEVTTDSVLNSKYPGDFYDLRDELEVKSNSGKATEEDAMRTMYMDSVSWDMSDLYKQKREIQNSDMTDSEKYEAVREIQEQINALAKNAMDGYNNVSVTGLYAEVGDRRYNKDADSGKWYEIHETNSDGSANYYYQMEQKVTQALGISYEEYWNNREEYNYAYEKPEQYTLSQAVGGYQAYRGYLSELWDIHADKDENGKSINGSRKEKVIDYLNNLDADYYTKIILFKNEYNADDTYNYEIIDYLNGREDISYEQMETILKYLGFDVDSNGNISWD